MSDTPIYDNGGNPDPEPEQNNDTPNKWIPSRAVRLWLYGIAVAVAALLIGYGFLTVEQGGLWLVLLASILGVAPAVAARNVPRG